MAALELRTPKPSTRPPSTPSSRAQPDLGTKWSPRYVRVSAIAAGHADEQGAEAPAPLRALGVRRAGVVPAERGRRASGGSQAEDRRRAPRRLRGARARVTAHLSLDRRISDGNRSPIRPPTSASPSDTHAGACDRHVRRATSTRAYRDDFEAWRGALQEPAQEAHRQQEDEELGLGRAPRGSRRATASSARCIFPNTVPPFYAKAFHIAPPRAAARSTSTRSRARAPTTAGWPTSAARRPSAARASG